MRTLTRVVVESLASAALAACHIKSEVVMGIVVSVRGGAAISTENIGQAVRKG